MFPNARDRKFPGFSGKNLVPKKRDLEPRPLFWSYGPARFKGLLSVMKVLINVLNQNYFLQSCPENETPAAPRSRFRWRNQLVWVGSHFRTQTRAASNHATSRLWMRILRKGFPQEKEAYRARQNSQVCDVTSQPVWRRGCWLNQARSKRVWVRALKPERRKYKNHSAYYVKTSRGKLKT